MYAADRGIQRVIIISSLIGLLLEFCFDHLPTFFVARSLDFCSICSALQIVVDIGVAFSFGWCVWHRERERERERESVCVCVVWVFSTCGVGVSTGTWPSSWKEVHLWVCGKGWRRCKGQTPELMWRKTGRWPPAWIWCRGPARCWRGVCRTRSCQLVHSWSRCRPCLWRIIKRPGQLQRYGTVTLWSGCCLLSYSWLWFLGHGMEVCRWVCRCLLNIKLLLLQVALMMQFSRANGVMQYPEYSRMMVDWRQYPRRSWGVANFSSRRSHCFYLTTKVRCSRGIRTACSSSTWSTTVSWALVSKLRWMTSWSLSLLEAQLRLLLLPAGGPSPKVSRIPLMKQLRKPLLQEHRCIQTPRIARGSRYSTPTLKFL